MAIYGLPTGPVWNRWNLLDPEPTVIAEIGSNHNGDMTLAKEMVVAAKEAGANAVKFQSWQPGDISSAEQYRRLTFGADDSHRHFGTLREMEEAYCLTFDMHREIEAFCTAVGIVFLSTAFTDDQVDLLDGLGVRAHKVASMDINHPRHLWKVAASGKPVMFATGMATFKEEFLAGDILESQGAVAIPMHCVSLYPAPADELNLAATTRLMGRFGRWGFSDHTDGPVAAIAAVARGASVIEKHFTIDKGLPGWDHWMSADPAELAELVDAVADAHAALGKWAPSVSDAEMAQRKRMRRSIVAAHNLPAGIPLTADDLAFKRPGDGLPPTAEERLIGRVPRRPIHADKMIAMEDME